MPIKKSILVLLFFLPNLLVYSQTVSIICGVYQGFNGDGGLAINASTNRPIKIIFDKQGNMYFTAYLDLNIRRIDAKTNIITTYVGSGVNGFSGDGGLASLARIGQTYGFCFDSSGNLYVPDENNSRLRKIDAVTHIITTIAGNGDYYLSGDGGLAENAGLSAIRLIVIDSKANLIIATELSIRKIDSRTHIITTIAGRNDNIRKFQSLGDNGPAIRATFCSIDGLSIDAYDNLYINDNGADWAAQNVIGGYGRIRKIDAKTGIISTIVGTGVLGYSGDGGLAINAQTGLTADVLFDAAGNLYFGDGGTFNGNNNLIDGNGDGDIFGVDNLIEGNGAIRKVDAQTGIITTIAGTGVIGFSGDGGSPLNAQFDVPGGIAFDSIGNIYIPDIYNNKIRKITYCTFPVSPIIGNNQICLGSNSPMQNATTGGVWASNDPNIATVDINGMVTGLQLGTAVIRYTVTNGGSSVSRSATLKITTPPPAISISGADKICGGDTATFTSNSTDGIWSSGDPAIATIDQYSGKLIGMSTGTTAIRYTINNGCGTVTNQQSVTTLLLPSADFTASASSICVNDIVVFTDMNSTATINSWFWQLGDVTETNSASFSSQFTDTGFYLIRHRVSDLNGCNSDTSSQLIYVNGFPTLKMQPDITLLQGSATNLQPVYINGNNLSFTWTPTTYLDNSDIENPIAAPVKNIQYHLLVKGKGGCSVEDSINIKILLKIEVPNVFSPNGDGINDNWVITGLSSYPNATVQVFSREGQLIFESAGYAKAWDGTFHGQPLPVGTYYYIICLQKDNPAVSGSITIIR